MKSKDLLELSKCFHCHQYPVSNRRETYCLVCLPWLKERQEWKERVFKRDEIIKELEKRDDDALVRKLKKTSSKKLMEILIDRGIATKQENVQRGKLTILGYYIWKSKLEENNESN